jgi:hypothetical protein
MSARRCALGLVRKPGLFATVFALGVIAAALLAGTASARVIFSDRFHEEETSIINNFCDSQGLTVRDTFTIDGRVHAVSRGGGAPYFLEKIRVTDMVTNLANGKFTVVKANVMQKDLRIRNNGDGTITITVLATGNAVLYDETGRPIARDPGQIRFRILIDTNGTLEDPFDDEELAFLGVVKGSTGRSDDFCAATVAALT